MDDNQLLQQIEQLVNEEHQLDQFSQAEGGLNGDQQARMRDLEVRLDQLWDLMRQRRARRRLLGGGGARRSAAGRANRRPVRQGPRRGPCPRSGASRRQAGQRAARARGPRLPQRLRPREAVRGAGRAHPAGTESVGPCWAA